MVSCPKRARYQSSCGKTRPQHQLGRPRGGGAPHLRLVRETSGRGDPCAGQRTSRFAKSEKRRGSRAKRFREAERRPGSKGYCQFYKREGRGKFFLTMIHRTHVRGYCLGPEYGQGSEAPVSSISPPRTCASELLPGFTPHGSHCCPRGESRPCRSPLGPQAHTAPMPSTRQKTSPIQAPLSTDLDLSPGP